MPTGRGRQKLWSDPDEPERDSPLDPRHAPPGGGDRRQAPPDHRSAGAARRRGQWPVSARALPGGARRLRNCDARTVRAYERVGSRRGDRRRRLRQRVGAATGRDRDPARRPPHARAARAPAEGGAGLPAPPLDRNRLRRRFDPDEAEIHVVDRDDRHVYQPGLLFVPFGLASLEEIVRPRRRQLRNGIEFHEAEVAWVELDHEEVVLLDGQVLPYDVLVVASGVRLQPEETEGMTGPGWNER